MNWAALSVEEAVEPVEFVVIHLDDQFVSTQCSHEGQGPGFGRYVGHAFSCTYIYTYDRGVRSRMLHAEEGSGGVHHPFNFSFDFPSTILLV